MFITLAIEHSLEDETPLESILVIAKNIAEKIGESTNFDMITDVDVVLHLEPGQYDRLCALSMYIERCIGDVYRITNIDSKFRKIMLKDIETKIDEYENLIRKALDSKK